MGWHSGTGYSSGGSPGRDLQLCMGRQSGRGRAWGTLLQEAEQTVKAMMRTEPYSNLILTEDACAL